MLVRDDHHRRGRGQAEGIDPPARSGRSGRHRRESLGLSRAILDPLSHVPDKLGVGERRFCSAVAGVPAAQDELVVGDVVEQLLQRPLPVLFGILQLASKLARSLALKDQLHLGRGQVPVRISRRHVRAGQVGMLVAVGAF
jgi:hypothetical protein